MATQILLDWGSSGLFLAFLLAAQVVGEQSWFRGLALRGGRRAAEPLSWAGLVLLYTLAAAPFIVGKGLAAWGLGAGVATAHELLRRVARRGEGGPLRVLAWQVGRQLLLACVLAGVVQWWEWTMGKPELWLLVAAQREELTRLVVMSLAYVVNIRGAAVVVGLVLQQFDLPWIVGRGGDNRVLGSEPAEPTGSGVPDVLAMGRMIGILERMLVLTFVLIEQWGALGLVLAAKSVARYKALEKRYFGEYFLIGTLTSMLCATIAGLAVKLLV